MCVCVCVTVYHIQCMRCSCTGTITKSLQVDTACSCLCCHYKDACCVYTSIDRCIDCHGKYHLQGGHAAWVSPYFSCEKNCLRTKKSPLSVNFEAITQNHRNNVRNTVSTSTQKTLLHSAVLACDPELTWDLLCRGANPFVKDRMGVTPIDLARLMRSGVSTSHSPRVGVSNEEKIYLLLPKQAYPDVSIEFPLHASEEVSKIRTHSDFGPESLNSLAHSPTARSPPHRRRQANRRPSPTDQQWQIKPSSTLHNEESSSTSVLANNDDSDDRLRPPPAMGLRVNLALCAPDVNSTSIMNRRRRSHTLTLSTHGTSAIYPPSPPRVTVVDHFSTSPNHRRRRSRASSMSATDVHHGERVYADTPMPLSDSGSYGFARRQRGMSLTESPTAAAGASKSLLTGIVNAGIRHAKANAPQLSQGKQVFSPMTLMRMNSGNDFVMEGFHDMPVVKEEDFEFEVEGGTDVKTSPPDREIKSEGEGKVKHDYKWEMQHLKSVVIAEVEVESCVPASDVPNTVESQDISEQLTQGVVQEVKQEIKPPPDTTQEILNPYAMFALSLDRNATPSPVPRVSSPFVPSGTVDKAKKQDFDTDQDEQEDNFDSGAVMVSCTSCMDLLPISDMKYTCPRLGCLSHLCQDCLFRLVFVTITSALYAVPAIRCPGRCMCSIPTRLWRGGLKGMTVAEDDREDLKVTDMPMMMLLDLLYNSFEIMCMDYEGGVVNEATRFKHTCTLLSRVQDIAVADGFSLQDIFGAVNDYTSSASSSSVHYGGSDSDSDSGSSEWEDDTDDEKDKIAKKLESTKTVEDVESSELDSSGEGKGEGGEVATQRMKFATFAEFSSFVLPGRVVQDSDVGKTFMALEAILNDSEVESARLNVKELRMNHMHNFLAEVAALVRTRMDVEALEAKYMDDGEREDAEELLMRRYMSNAQALLKIRCSGCDDTANLLHTIENGKKVITSPAEREKVLDKIVSKIDSDENRMAFLRTYCNFMNGKAPSSLFITAVFESFINTKKCDFEEDEEDRNDEIRKSAKNGILKQEAAKHVTKVMSLIIDMERRFAAQLEVLRKFPKIKLVCCDTKHCFLCKVGGHHKGQSCAEVQREEMGSECQFCPGCGVATLRTEGCKEVLCVCGTVWKWVDEDEASSTEGDWEDDSDSDGDY